MPKPKYNSKPKVLKRYVAEIKFSDDHIVKYVIQRYNYYEAKEECDLIASDHNADPKSTDQIVNVHVSEKRM